ncbi:hypothetical protein [Nocardia fluminea]|uniref:hypothetical protein n=1 Tax=Nocardia fluminea TaxID=134984 RepID=UPI0033F7BBA1
MAVISAGPEGLATALSAGQAGHDVTVFERYAHARVAGNILNLWPGPIKVPGLMGVDTDGLGVGREIEFRSLSGHRRVRVNCPSTSCVTTTAATSGRCGASTHRIRRTAPCPLACRPTHAEGAMCRDTTRIET